MIDTHAWVWFVLNDARLPEKTKAQVQAAEAVIVPTVCIYEIGQKVRMDRWPGMSVGGLDKLISDAKGRFALRPTDTQIAKRASLMDWGHRDPFDRIIAATALEDDAPLISRDRVFDSCDGLERLWGA